MSAASTRMSFECLPWHDAVWRQVRAAVAQDRVPHAWLVSGPAGVGKGAFARRLSAALLCRTPGDDGDACGVCAACGHFLRDTHADFLSVAPEPDKRDISVDAIRTLSERLSLKAEGGRYRVALVEPADALTVQAMNALLKTLEEPPGRGVLILVTARPARLLATIRSRCRAVTLAPPDRATGRSWLGARLPDAAGEAVDTALAVARGGPLAAEALLREKGLAARREAFDAWLALSAGRRNPVALAEQWQGDAAPRCLHWLNGWVLDLMRLQAAAEPPRLDNPDLAAELRPWADRLSLRALSDYQARLIEWLGLLETTANRQLLVEEALIRWQSLTRARQENGAG